MVILPRLYIILRGGVSGRVGFLCVDLIVRRVFRIAGRLVGVRLVNLFGVDLRMRLRRRLEMSAVVGRRLGMDFMP